MKLTFTVLERPTDAAVSRAYVGRDEQGRRQIFVLVWIEGMVEVFGGRWAAYPVNGCALDNPRFQEVAAFALARLDNGLELDGATVEV